MPRSPLRVSRTYWANCWGQRLAQAEALAQDLDLLGRDQAVAGQVLGRVAWQHPEQEEVEHQHEGQAEEGPSSLAPSRRWPALGRKVRGEVAAIAAGPYSRSSWVDLRRMTSSTPAPPSTATPMAIGISGTPEPPSSAAEAAACGVVMLR